MPTFPCEETTSLYAPDFSGTPASSLSPCVLAERTTTDGFPEKAAVWEDSLDCWGTG